MKKKIAYLIAMLAMMATGAASMGCVWAAVDEPKALRSMCD